MRRRLRAALAFTALVGCGAVLMAACGGRSLEVPGADSGAGGLPGIGNNNNNNNSNNNTGTATTRTATATTVTATTTTTTTGFQTTGFQATGVTGTVTGSQTGTFTFTAATATSTGTTGRPTTGTTGMLPTGAGGAPNTSVVTGFTAISTTGVPLESTGECDAPYNLGSLLGTVTSVTRGEGQFMGDCGGYGPEVWFVWQAPETGRYSVNTFGSEFDTVLYQLTQPNCAGRGVVQCNDDVEDSLDSELQLQAQAGEFITFVVDSYDEGDNGRYQLQINLEEPQPGTCSEPLAELEGVGVPLVSQPVPFNDQTLNNSSVDQCNGGPPRIVFGWTAPVTGRFQFDTFGSNYDTVLALRASCDDTRGALCNDDSLDLQSSLTVQLQAGTHIRIEIAAFGGSVTTDGGAPEFVLNVQNV